MPELPEVETVRRGLNELIIGRQIKTVSFDTARSFPNDAQSVRSFMTDATVIVVRRRAKVLMIDLSTDYTLVIHLKMTGQLVFVSTESRFGAGHPNDSLIGDLPDKSTRVIIKFADESQLFFNDQRKFGWMKLIPTLEVPNMAFMLKVGPEPLASEFTPGEFAARFTRRANTSIKAALLDQSVIAGVGNIYADESLWAAKIHPRTKVADVQSTKYHLLYTELRSIMNLAIQKGGSTDRNYVNAEGEKGSYMDFARVFRREGLECPRCGTVIVKFKSASRGTHICPHCQIL